MTPMSDSWPSYTAGVTTPEGGRVWVQLSYGRGRDESKARWHLWVGAGKHGTVVFTLTRAIARVANLSLEKGATLDEVRDEVAGMSHDKSGQHEGLSIPDAISVGIGLIEEHREHERVAA